MSSTPTAVMAGISVASFALLLLSFPRKSHGLYRVVAIPDPIVPNPNPVKVAVPKQNENMVSVDRRSPM